MKLCTKCKAEKPLIEFNRRKDSKDGLLSVCKSCDSIYRKNNKGKRSIYYKNRSKTDIQYKLSIYLRARLNKVIRGKYKSGSAVRDLGCSISELKLWLESLFTEGMTWNNHGNKEGQWSIDHRIPLSWFDLTDREQLLEAVNFINLQPMWHADNMKKHNKI